MELGRLLTAMVTPFNADLEVDYAAAERLAQHLIDNGSDGLVVCGTTGESPTLSEAEKLELFRVVKRVAAGKAAVIAGTGNYCTASSMELTRKAEQIGVDAVLLVAPYYNKPSQEGLYQHFKAIAAGTELPIVLYNIPGRTSVNIEPKTIIRLAEIPNIVAVKEASKSLEAVAEIRSHTPDSFYIFSGDDSITIPVMSVGGHGIVSVASHLCGPMLHEMIDKFAAGDNAGALELHLKLLPLFKALFVATNPVPVKYGLNRAGIPVGGVRLPLVQISDADAAIVDAAMAGIGLA